MSVISKEKLIELVRNKELVITPILSQEEVEEHIKRIRNRK